MHEENNIDEHGWVRVLKRCIFFSWGGHQNSFCGEVTFGLKFETVKQGSTAKAPQED